MKKMGQSKYSILICTDFAFPKFGGVETHGYQLGQCLIERGHKVTFISNKFKGTRCGVRFMANGMKVYHIPHVPVLNGDVAFFSFINSLPLIR
jgi:phosphatidylinositol glycan class A protein